MTMQDLLGIVERVSALLSPAALGGLLFYRSRRRTERAQSERAIAESLGKFAEEWRELYEYAEKKLAEKDKKIDALYIELTELRKQRYDEMRASTSREIELIKEVGEERISSAKYHCEVPKCSKRQPQNGY